MTAVRPKEVWKLIEITGEQELRYCETITGIVWSSFLYFQSKTKALLPSDVNQTVRCTLEVACLPSLRGTQGSSAAAQQVL